VCAWWDRCHDVSCKEVMERTWLCVLGGTGAVGGVVS